jgi:PAS domain S-box-containing protein
LDNQKKHTESLLFLGNQNLPPMVYLGNGSPNGIAVDIVTALGAKMGRSIEVKAMDWSEAQTIVEKGEADALIQINESEERKKMFDFSDSLLESKFSVFTISSRKGISKTEDLRGLRIGVEEKGFPRIILQRDPLMQIVNVPSILEGFHMLKEAQVDVVIADQWVGTNILSNYGINDVLIVGDPIAQQQSSIAVKKGNTELLLAINKGLREMKADGTYQIILNKWEPQEVVFQTREQIRMNQYEIGIRILILFVIVSIIWLILLSLQLFKRKRMEQTLAEERRRLSNIIIGTNVGTWEWNIQTGEIVINERWADIIGYTLEEISPVSIETWRNFLQDEDKIEFENQLNMVFDRKIDYYDIVYRMKHKDSSWIWIQDRGSVTSWNSDWKPHIMSGTHADITEVKNTQEKLQKSQQDTAEILNSISDPFVTVDGQWRITYVNQGFASRFGKIPADLLGQNYLEVFSKVVGTYAHQQFLKTMSEKVPTHFVERPIYIDAWFEFNVYSYKDGISIYIRDITEKKQLEQKIVDALEFNQAILESSPLGVFAYNSSGQCILTNDAGVLIDGGTREQILEVNYNNHEHWKETGLLDTVKRVLLTGTPEHLEVNVRNVFGKQAWFDFRFSRFISNGELHLLLVNDDITDRKQAEEEHRQSNEKFSKAFHGIPIMMTLATMEEGRFIDANEALCTQSGYTREEIIDHTSIELNMFPYIMRPELSDMIMERGRLENYELDLRTKSGEMHKCLCWTQLLHIDGALCHITALIDITEQKRIEKEMDRLDRLNLIGEMAASIGHEIRNPMTSVRGFIQLLNEQEYYAKDKVYFDLMIEELDRANEIISEYLGMAKDRNIALQPQYIDQIVKDIYPLIEADANNKGMNIKLDLGKPPMPLIDKNEIRQLILNIARNGMEAMPPGGTLTIGTTVAKSEIVLFIKDEGQGLPPELLDKLGTPFLTTKTNGTGLGLAVCYSIAARHKARIDFITNSDGTTFYVRFPVPEQEILLF